MRAKTGLIVVAAIAALMIGGGIGALDRPVGAGRAEADGLSWTVVGSPEPSVSASSPARGPSPRLRLSTARSRAIDAVPDGSLGLAVYDTSTGRSVLRYRATVEFPSESVVKLLIALDALDRGTAADRVSEMLSRSDDAVASQLWVQGGGPDLVTRMAARIGLTHTTPPSLPYMWGDTTVTADDVVAVYRYILNRAPEEREVILSALRDATRTAADGFDQYFGIPDAAGGWPWAVKQGWACCNPYRALHTTGLVGRYIVVALTEHPAATGWQTDKAELTTVVADLLPALSGPAS